MNWIHLAQDRDRLRVFVNTVIDTTHRRENLKSYPQSTFFPENERIMAYTCTEKNARNTLLCIEVNETSPLLSICNVDKLAVSVTKQFIVR
jgi:hypothetical protein